MARRILRAIVSGRVQGVGYRAFAADGARRLRLDGFVRNLPDGTVETLASGPDAALEAYLAHLRRGPPGSAVADVAVEERDAGAAPPPGFAILR